MRKCRWTAGCLTAAAAIAGSALVAAGQVQLPLEPKGRTGQSVTPAYEGWYQNPDGSFNLLFGYYNRNQAQALDIPVGPNNRIEPGGPDYGQPTHFMAHRQWGVLTITVPKDFGSRKLTWTIVANGQSMSVPVGLNPVYVVEPFRDAAMGNTPPLLRFNPGGPAYSGPPRGTVESLDVTMPNPAALTVWLGHQPGWKPELAGAAGLPKEMVGPELSLNWSKYRGPGTVTFDRDKPQIDKPDGKATALATFSAAGEYVLRAQVNDNSGDGGSGFQCCWTNALVKVTVKPPR
jgi:hypothetical protein